MSKAILDLGFFKKCLLVLVCSTILTSTYAAITVITPLPSNLTKCEGDSLMLSISLTSDSTLEFVWKRNGTLIGSNSPVLVIPTASLTDSGTYTCDIKELGTTNTNTQTCHVVVNPKPVILTHPSGAISPMCEGSNLMLYVDVANATPVWRKNGNVLSIGMDTFSKSAITIADTGSYNVLARALIGCRDTISNSFSLVVKQRARIMDTLPTNIRLRDGAGMSAVLKVRVEGNGPFAFQWYKNGSIIPGANSDSFKIYSYTSATDSGIYRVCVNTTIPCSDTVCSNNAPILPTNCPLIINQTDTTLNACMGGTAIMEVNAVGVHSYQWYKANSSGSQDSMEGAVYSRFIIANVDSTAAGYYNLVLAKDPAITEDCGSVDKFKRVHLIVNPRQAITIQPQPNASCEATSHTLKVQGTNATAYQWYKNGIAITGATDSNYTVSPVTMTPDEYKVHVKNPFCTDEPSQTVLVRQMTPSTMVKLAINDRLNLLEQCTDNMGWTYYAHESNKQELLFAINKNGNSSIFSPDIRFTGGFIKELEPTSIEKKVVLMGLRMFTIKLQDTNATIANPYAVKFFYNDGPSEKGLFLSTIQARRNTLIPINEFSTDLPLDELSFVTSTHDYMEKILLSNQSTAPISFPYNIVTDKSFGSENSVKYAQINNLVTSKGGGTFYFHYYKKASSGISNNNSGEISIYPNPSNGIINIDLKSVSSQESSVIVSDITGKEVKRFNQLSKDNKLDCSDLSSGNYLIQIDNGNSLWNSKMTISK